MKKALVLTLVLLTGAAFAESVNVFKCGFEESEGYNLGVLRKQVDWTGDRNAEANTQVVDTDSFSGNRSVYFSGGSRVDHAISYSNPYQAKILFSFVIRPSENYVRTYLNDSNNNNITTIHIKLDDVYLDAGHASRSKNYNLNSSEWYPISILLDPKLNEIVEIYVGDNLYVAPDEDFAYRDGASGEINSISFQVNTLPIDSYVDDISVDLVPEPASIGLLALAGLFLLRKRS
jgi:opacity protein-like surface antigen